MICSPDLRMRGSFRVKEAHYFFPQVSPSPYKARQYGISVKSSSSETQCSEGVIPCTA
jgi:hypothetical protein